jgi:4-amino-4-deoxy-L-arabinose transferase-like glycosyltransferase
VEAAPIRHPTMHSLRSYLDWRRLLPLAVVLAVAFAARLVVLHQMARDPDLNVLWGDGRTYVAWADSIRAGDWLGQDVFYQAPLYPYLLAVERAWFGPDLQTLRLLQALLGAAGCVLLAAATGRLFRSPAIGCMAGLLLALYPAAIGFDLEVDKTVLDPVFAAALLACLAALLDGATGRRWYALGLVVGLAALTRENSLVVLPLALVGCGFWWRHEGWRRRLRWMGALVAGVATPVVPVSVRNSVIGHEFHLTTAQFGPNFYIGNSAAATGLYEPLQAGPARGDPMFERSDATRLAEADAGRPLSPGEVSRHWVQRAWQDIREQPGRWLRLMLRKEAMVLADTELSDSPVHDEIIVWSPVLATLDAAWGFGVLLPLAVLGICTGWRQRARWLPVAALAAVYALSVALFFILGRYRMMLVVYLIPLAALGLAGLAASLGERRVASLGVAVLGVALAVGVVFAAERAIPAKVKGTNFSNRAIMADASGQADRAIELNRKAIRTNPGLAAAYENLAFVLAQQQRFPEAAEVLVAAPRMESSDPVSQIDLGRILLTQEKYPAAIERFRRAVELAPQDPAARYYLGVSQLKAGAINDGVANLRAIATLAGENRFAAEAARILQGLTQGKAN